MKKPILLIFFLLLTSPLHGQSLTLRTYYPAPIGAYDRLRLVPRTAIGGTSCALGSLYTNADDNNSLYFCWDDSIDGEWGPVSMFGVWTQSGDDIYLTDASTPGNKKVGIGTSTPEFKLSLNNNNGGIIAHGTFGAGNPLATTGAGTRFIWYPKKAALRAGEVTGAQWNDINIGNHSVAFGLNNQASGAQSAIAGGEGNTVSTLDGAIGGGLSNTVSANYAAIVGGKANSASGTHAFVGGGLRNTASGSISVVIGGIDNTAAGDGSTIQGGGENQIIDATSIYSTISGGWQNVITSSQHAVISGGAANTITAGNYAAIGGGEANQANADYAAICGGQGNNATGLSSAICGGSGNSAAGDYSVVGGGQANTAGADHSTIAGGRSNDTTGGAFSFIGGGDNNETSGLHSVVTGGLNNVASGEKSFIGGGSDNAASGTYSVIPGGSSNTAAGDYSWAGGENINIINTADNTFAWGHDNSNPIDISQNDAFIIATGNVGINTITPSEKLHVKGNIRVDNGSIILKSPPSVSGSPLEINGTGVIGLDIAETFETNEDVEVGDLLVIDPTQDMKLKKSRTARDKKIVGIVSGTPALVFKGSQVQMAPQPFEFIKGRTPPVALSGRVLCKVSLENGPIKPGDLLTSSSLSGHAMKAVDRNKSFNAIVGKALEPFNNGGNGEKTGIITILMTIQ